MVLAFMDCVCERKRETEGGREGAETTLQMSINTDTTPGDMDKIWGLNTEKTTVICECEILKILAIKHLKS